MKNTDCTDSTTDYLLISLVESTDNRMMLSTQWDWASQGMNSDPPNLVQLNGNGLFLEKIRDENASSRFWTLDTDSFNRKYADPHYQHLDPNNPRCADMIWRSSANPDASPGAGIHRIPCDQQRGYCTEKIGIASADSDHENKIISWIDGYDYNTGVLCYYNNLADATTNVDNASCTGDSDHDRVSSFGHNHDLYKDSSTSTGDKGQYPYRECILPNSLGVTNKIIT